ncbi:MAG: FAD:protein FMN transferase [Bacteroidetes bacterium]|nr:MAG: FAD:protein FMN transferase [Bacteroidota bacterium]
MVSKTELIHPLSRRSFLKVTGSLALGSALLPFSSVAKEILPLKEINRAAFTMGSIVTFTCYHEDELLCNLAIDEAIVEMKTIDRLMSVHNPDSHLSLVNRHSFEKEVTVDMRIVEVITRAKQFHDLTAGAFDVTIEPLMKLYGFRDDVSVHRFPTDKEVAQTLEGVGMNNVTKNKELRTISLAHKTTQLDLGGIAVGYAIDRAIAILKSNGIESALINHSGDIYALGAPPEEDFWEIGIVDPMLPEEIITTTRINNQALSTSGNYENFVEADGKRIGHLLNPATGKPSSTILSGTTIAPSAIEADALSTGLFVMGIEKAKNVMPQLNHVQFIGVVENGEGQEIVRM